MPFWNEALETLPWHEVERWQAGRLADWLPGLAQRSGMYARLHAGVGPAPRLRSLDDLQALPFTTKDAIREAQDAATDEQPLGDNQGAPTEALVQCISSSGTTGAPIYYGLTAADVDRVSDDVVAHLVGLPMLAGGLAYADGFRRIGAMLCWLGGFPTDRILREMRRLRVTALLATTSFGLYLSEQWPLLDGHDHPASRLRKVLCGGEPGLDQPEVRGKITAGLGIGHLRETMGLGDVIPAMWGECEALGGMHFNAQRHVAIELIDPQSRAVLPWREGASGEMVYTALARDATPVVRYRSRDHVLVTGTDRCACGRTSPRIRCIGRTDDMLIYKGMNVFPTSIREVIAAGFAGRVDPTIRVWREHAGQVRFDDRIAVDVEASAQVAPGDYAMLARQIESEARARLQVRIAVTVLAPGALPRNVYKNSLLATRTPAASG